MSPESPVAGILGELRLLLEAEGGLLAGALRPAMDQHRAGDLSAHDGESMEVFAPLVAGGRRTSSDPRGYGLVVESILEGYLLHYGRGRIVDDPDPDLRLLTGDHLYAFGLVRLASIGDLEAVDELSDLISLCAQVHATPGREKAESAWKSAAALWASAVLAITGGPWQAQQAAKRTAREEGSQVIEKVLDAARDRAHELGLAPRLEHALIAFQRTVEG
jgi:hypothetical protein